MKRTRENHIPADAELYIQDLLSSAMIYRYERGGNPVGIAFRGKSQKPSWHYRFRSQEERQQYEQKFLESVRAEEERSNQYKAQKNAQHTLKAGDILYSSWGYEQTNIDFFQVVDVKSKTLALQEIGVTTVEVTGWASDSVIPDPSHKIGPVFNKRANGFNHVRLDDCRTASPYDGRALHRSWYA